MDLKINHKISNYLMFIALVFTSSYAAATSTRVKFASDTEYPFELNWENARTEQTRREPAQSANELPVEERVKKRMFAGGSDDQSLDVLSAIPKFRFENEVIFESFD